MAFSLSFKRSKAKQQPDTYVEPALQSDDSEAANMQQENGLPQRPAPPMPVESPNEDAPESKGGGLLSKLSFSKSSSSTGQLNNLSSPIAGLKKKKLPALKKHNRFVLMLGDEGGILVYIEKGLVIRRVYAPSAEKQHIKPFVELMQAHPKVPLYVLCDMVDQSYVRHTLPPVSPLSIQKLVNRRLQRDFSPEDIKGSLSLGREKGGRKEWNYMLISLANSDTLQQWMDPVLEMPNKCVGLYLVPVESQAFIRNFLDAIRLGEGVNESKWKILVSHDKVSGFRQVVLKDGVLIFTRLTQLSSDTPPEVMAGNIEQEVLNTIEYLRRMSFDERDGLDVIVIVAQDVRDLLEAQKMGASNVKMFTPFEASKILQLPQAALSGDRFADVVMCANFAMRQKGKLKLLSGYAKKLDQIYQAILGVKVVGSLAVLYLLYSSVTALMVWQSAGSEISEAQARLNIETGALKETQRRYDALGDDQTRVMRISALYRKTERTEGSPLEFARLFGEVKSSNVRVLEWSWAPAKQTDGETQSRQRSKQKNKKKTDIQFRIGARVEILDHNGDVRILSQNVRSLIERVKIQFPEYAVSRGMLPQEKEAAQKDSTLVIDLNQPAPQKTFELQPGDEYIELEWIGPDPSKMKGAS